MNVEYIDSEIQRIQQSMQKPVFYFKGGHSDNTQNSASLGSSLIRQVPEFLQDVSDIYVSYSHSCYFLFTVYSNSISFILLDLLQG